MNLRIARLHWGARLAVGALLASAVAATVAPLAEAQTAHDLSAITVPAVPDGLQVPAGNEVFFEGHAVGTQNYVCLPSGNDFKYALFTPRATLFGDDRNQLTTHFFSPNPLENGTVRVTWQNSLDTSTVWGQAMHSSSDADFVGEDAIPWLLLQAVGSQNGPSGGDTLTGTTFVQRLNTRGGLAPSSECQTANDVGRQAFVPYTADYFFYTSAD